MPFLTNKSNNDKCISKKWLTDGPVKIFKLPVIDKRCHLKILRRLSSISAIPWLGSRRYCKTLIIRVTLFSQGHQLGSRDFILAICHILFYDPYRKNYSRQLYFRISILSRIYAKIKSSRIKVFTVTNLWNSSCETGNRTPDLLLRKPRA